MAYSGGYYKTATLDHTQAGSADSTNWVLTIGRGVGPQSADANLKTVGNGGHVQNANGYDIRPYDSTGTTALAYELVYYDATTGSVEMHVKIATLSHSSDTVIRLYYGDASLNTNGSSNTTWNSNFAAVWHFPNGSSLTANDSTSNANNGTLSTPTATTGQIDGGANFNGSSDKISMSPTSSLEPTGAWSSSAWFKTSGSVSLYATILGGADYDGKLAGYEWGINAAATATHKIVVFQSDYVAYSFAHIDIYNGTTTVDDQNWHFVTVSVNGSGVASIFVDGGANEASLQTGYSNVPPAYNGADVHRIGEENATIGGESKFFPGIIDEVRLLNGVNVSQSWATADYNSQKASSTFITWGTETANGTTVVSEGFFNFF